MISLQSEQILNAKISEKSSLTLQAVLLPQVHSRSFSNVWKIIFVFWFRRKTLTIAT